MGAKFELSFASKSYVELADVLSLFDVLFGNKITGDLIAYPDWSLAADTGIITNTPEIPQRLADGFIIYLNGICGHTDLGMLLHLSQNIYCYELWIDTAMLPALDSEPLSDGALDFYEQITSCMISVSASGFLYAAMGCELCIDYSGSIQSTIAASHNVVRWILNSDCQIDQLDSFSPPKQVQNKLIFTKEVSL